MSEKRIGADIVTMSQIYDSAGRPSVITYFPSSPQERNFLYSFDGLGNMEYLVDVTAGRYLVAYTDFTAVGQYQLAAFQKSGSNSVISEYAYDPVTKRLSTLLTRKFVNSSPVLTYQDLEYDVYDNMGTVYFFNRSYTDL